MAEAAEASAPEEEVPADAAPAEDGDGLEEEWDSMVGDGDAAPTTGSAAAPERILNQDEIDSLLGFSVADDDGADRSGIRAIRPGLL
mgnify:FL=1